MIKSTKKSTIKSLIFALLSLSTHVILMSCQTTNSANKQTESEIETQLSVVASFIDAGTPDKALKEIKPLFESYPNDPRVLNMMGLTQLALRNFNRSVTYFQKSFALDPKISTGLNLSAVYIEMGKLPEAEKTLKKVSLLKEDPPYKYPERIYHNFAIVYERTNRVHLAEKNYKKALEENPTYYMARLQLGRLYENTKRMNLAITTLEEAHYNCPVCLDPVTDLAKNYVRQNNPDKAKKLVSTYIKTEGVSAEDLSKANEMQKELQKAVSKEPPKEPLPTNSNR